MTLSLLMLLAVVPMAPQASPDTEAPWDKLKRASAFFALGQEARGKTLSREAVTGDARLKQAAQALEAGYYVCAGKLPQAKTVLGRLKTAEGPVLSLMAVKTSTFAFLAPFPASVLTKQVAQLYDIMNLVLCHHLGKLYIADRLHPALLDAKKKRKLEGWAIAYLRTAPQTDYKLFGSFIAFRILAQRKMDQLFASGVFTLEEASAYEAYLKSGAFPAPFPEAYPWRISVLLPLTGRYRSLGKQMLLAIMAARTQWPALEFVVHDTRSSPAHSLLVLKESVVPVDKPIAVFLPPDTPSVQALLASGIELPMLSVGTPLASKRTAGSIFFGQLTREQITSSLAQTAIAMGISRFAVIYPDKAYGKAHAAAFVKTVESLRGRIVLKSKYRFGAMPSRLNLKGVQAVFIPDAASRVELVARIMAASGYFARPWNSKKRKGLLILSTAPGLSSRTIRNSSRYLDGAIFAPGYFGLPTEILPQLFLKWGIDHVLVHAYETWNFASLVHTAVKAGATSHKELQAAFFRLSAGPGLGALFSHTGFTRRPTRLYQLRKSTLHLLNLP